MQFPDWLKRLVAGSELAELERWRLWCDEHHKWLAHEFPDVAMTLDNLRYYADGTRIMDGSYPPGCKGPWDVSGLREVLRRGRAKNAA